MDAVCILNADDGEQLKIAKPTVLPENLEVIPNFVDSTISLNLKKSGEVLLNGYSLLIGESYVMKPGDVLKINVRSYSLCFQNIVQRKRSRSPRLDVATGSEGVTKVAKLAAIFERKSPLPDIDGTWNNQSDLVTFVPTNWKDKTLIAGFDLDSTLIKTKSGKTFPINHHDWTFFALNVPKKLVEYDHNGYSINIFTNQLQAGGSIQTLNLFKNKVVEILKHINCPVRVFAALKRNIYRKPAPGMWDAVKEIQDPSIPIDMKKSFYVGDAAGRVAVLGNKKKNDHSMADRLFALNLGLRFQTPEELFLGALKDTFRMPQFDPRTYTQPAVRYDFSNEQEVIFMVGCPASGKSTFCNREIRPRGYRYISRDQLNSWQACTRVLQAALKEKKSVVLDNTHRDKDARKKYMDIIKQYNVPCRCFVMPLDKSLIRHNNTFRQLTDVSHTLITDTLIYTYYKHYEEPALSEGFTEIVQVAFQPVFDNVEHEKLYRMFLLEK